ncbi:helix-turn-helix domain-containing protein [Paenibacillus aceti]|uniref:HTH cro/C1-type domain-containing protein n=1 Tax=Paenibacillus aceti TaxID=1820010 RepID=A0ABQ1W5K8_9BACL|nr:helix-turn-helix transcriptional regulator [Paenibacillus aceti]GGG15423.1 hypothetical protein GCM10010913_41670 [Paenibacillus aceti]
MQTKNEFECFNDISLRGKYKLLRQFKGIKLKQISAIVGVSVPMLSMYENEIVNLSRDKEEKYRTSIIKISNQTIKNLYPMKEVSNIE